MQRRSKYGYFLLPTKTVLIVKPEYKEIANEAFEGTDVKITTEEERHMCAVMGSDTSKELYVKERVAGLHPSIFVTGRFC